MNIKEVFGKKLKHLRQEKGMTQAELAALANVSTQMISSYEKCAKEPTLTNAASIANALNVSLAFLIDEASHSTNCDAIKIETYGDVIRVIDKLDTAFRGNFIYDAGHGVDIQDMATQDFISKHYKMRELLDNDTISYDLYRSWIEGEIAKGDKEALPQYD